jgi:anti-sigma B factor antagonist
MMIDATTEGGTLLLTIGETRLDASVALAFKEAMRGRVAGHDGPVAIDMARVEFMDSSGLGALVAAMKMLGGARRLELAGCRPIVARVLALTRMDRVFVLHEDVDAMRAAGRDAA